MLRGIARGTARAALFLPFAARPRSTQRSFYHAYYARTRTSFINVQSASRKGSGRERGGWGWGDMEGGSNAGQKGTYEAREARFFLSRLLRSSEELPPPPTPQSWLSPRHRPPLLALVLRDYVLSIRDVFSRSCLNPRLKPRRQIRLLIINRVGSLLLPLLRPPLFPFFREKVRFGGGRYIVISVPLARHRTGPLRGFIKNYMRLIKTYRPPPLLPSLALVSLLLSPSPRPSGHGEVSPGSERGRLDTSQNQIAR